MKRTFIIQVASIAAVIGLAATSCKQASYGVNEPTTAAPPPPAPAPAPTPAPAPAPAPTPAPVPAAPNNQITNTSTGVTFGTTGVFHLGDGVFGGSTCQSELTALPLNGTKFHFVFSVSADNTPINIAVTDLCGVDLDNDLVTLTSATGFNQPSIAIPVNATSMTLPPVTINKGTYTLTIVSGQNIDNPKFIMGNFDDFIVGHVQVQGPNIQGISFSAQP